MNRVLHFQETESCAHNLKLCYGDNENYQGHSVYLAKATLNLAVLRMQAWSDFFWEKQIIRPEERQIGKLKIPMAA